MNKEFVQKGIILPVITGIILSIVFSLFISSNIEKIMPVTNGAELAYYDAAGDEVKLGTVEGEYELPLYENADYTESVSCAELVSGSSKPGETGCMYIRLTANHSDFAGENLSVSGVDYKLEGEMKAENENEILSVLPKAEKSAVVYYKVSKGYGLTSEYKAFIYKEAK